MQLTHNFDSKCNCRNCDKNFEYSYIEIYALSMHKNCLSCNSYYKADKPWYYYCKQCVNKLNINYHQGGTQCSFCKEQFYKNVKIINIVSGNFKASRTTTRDTYRKIIPYSLREESRKIPLGKHFSGQVCYNHLSIADNQISKLSTKKALIWSHNKTYPFLFRIKCFKMAYIPINDVKSRKQILNIIDNYILIYEVLISNNMVSDINKYILFLL